MRAMTIARITTSDPFTVMAEQPMYRTRKLPSRAMSLEVSRALEQTLVGVPCYPELTESEICRIEDVLGAA